MAKGGESVLAFLIVNKTIHRLAIFAYMSLETLGSLTWGISLWGLGGGGFLCGYQTTASAIIVHDQALCQPAIPYTDLRSQNVFPLFSGT